MALGHDAENRGPHDAENRGPHDAENRSPLGVENRSPLGAENRSPLGAENRSPLGDPDTDEQPAELTPSPFAHPEWTVGLVLVAGVITLVFGVLVTPLALLMGSPFLIVLVLWVYVKLSGTRRRGTPPTGGSGSQTENR